MTHDSGRAFYVMSRGWLEHPVFKTEPFCQRAAWCWLIEQAQFQERRINLNGQIVTLKRGELAHSLRYIATAWGWSEVGIRRFFSRLKTDAMIDARIDAGRLIVSICNYDKYQFPTLPTGAAGDAPSDARPTHDRRTTDAKKKEGKEGKEGKEDRESASSSSKPAQPKQTKRTKPKTPISPDRQPDEQDRQFAISKGFNHEWIDAEYQRFICHHLAKGTESADWNASWRTWVLNDPRYGGSRRGGPSSGRSSNGGIAAVVSRLGVQGRDR